MSMGLRYQDGLQAVVDERNEVVLEIQNRSDGRYISCLLHLPGNLLRIRASQFSRGEGIDLVIGWRVHDFSGFTRDQDQDALKQRLVSALRAYGLGNGFGASDSLPVIFE